MVSVIIPNFNNAGWISKCLESCLLQRQLKEIIVVDDHSTDNSWDLLCDYTNRFPALIRIFKNPEKGANSARAYGFEHATGDFIQWLDSDDIILPGKFEAQIQTLRESGRDIAYSDWQKDYYENGLFLKSTTVMQRSCEDFTEELLKDRWVASHSYLLTYKIAKLLDDASGWNPNTQVGQDREYFTLAAIMGAQFVYVPGIYAIYNRWSSTSISGLEFGKRLSLNQVMERRFEKEILHSNLISSQKRKKYLHILNTHTIKAFFYKRTIPPTRIIWPWSVCYSLMHWKMALAMPIVFAHYYFSFVKLKIKGY